MNISLIKSLKTLAANKLRMFLTVSGIAVGVMSVIIISIIGETGKQEINVMLADMGMDNVIVSTEAIGSNRLVESDLEKIKGLSNVENAMPLINMTTTAKLGREKDLCMVWGVNEDADNVIELKPVYGRLINQGDVAVNANVCVIDEQIAEDAYRRSNVLGKMIDININGKTSEFEIIGVVQSGANLLQSMLGNIIPSFVYIPYTSMQNKTSLHFFDQIAVKLINNSIETEESIKRTLSFEGHKIDDINVEDLLTQKEQLTDIVGTVTVVLSVIAGISLIVSGLSIMNVMLVSVNERKREIGIKKSIGASNSDILKEFLAEAAAITAIGTAAGVAAGIIICIAGCAVFNVSSAISAEVIITASAFSGAAGIIFGVYPAYKAAKLKPVDALRSDG